MVKTGDQHSIGVETRLHSTMPNLFNNSPMYIFWEMNMYFNTQVIVKMFQICHLKTFLQLFLYGCNKNFIIPCYQQIIYIHYNIYHNFPTFLTNRVALSRLKCLKFNFRICSIIFSYQACDACLRPYKDLMSLHTFCFYPFTKKTFWLRHEDILFQIFIQESIFQIYLMNFPSLCDC
jgi:hypothetical protein